MGGAIKRLTWAARARHSAVCCCLAALPAFFCIFDDEDAVLHDDSCDLCAHMEALHVSEIASDAESESMSHLLFPCMLAAPAATPHNEKDCLHVCTLASVWQILDELDTILGNLAFGCAECFSGYECGSAHNSKVHAVTLSLAELIPDTTCVHLDPCVDSTITTIADALHDSVCTDHCTVVGKRLSVFNKCMVDFSCLVSGRLYDELEHGIPGFVVDEHGFFIDTLLYVAFDLLSEFDGYDRPTAFTEMFEFEPEGD